MKLIIIFLFVFNVCQSRTTDKEKQATIQSLQEIIASCPPSEHLGLKVISLKTGEIIYEKNAENCFTPASTAKIVTALAALDLLGPDYIFKTELLGDEKNTYLKGSGDPSFSVSDLDELVHACLREGRRELKGNLFIDQDVFDQYTMGPGWMWDEGANYYNPFITGLVLNRNCIDLWIRPARFAGLAPIATIEPSFPIMQIDNQALTSQTPKEPLNVERKWLTHENTIEIKGSLPLDTPLKKHTIAVENPLEYASYLLKNTFKRQGLSFEGDIQQGLIPSEAKTLISHESLPLYSLLLPLLKKSDNFYAECFFKTLGKELFTPPGSWPKGAKAIRYFLEKNHLKNDKITLLDGSGLSRYNLLSPDFLVQLLKWAHEQFLYSHLFKAALNMNGIDGLLKKRLSSPEFKGRIKSKSGFMTGVFNLAGYITTLRGEELAFALMINGLIKAPEAFRIQDQICETLIHYRTLRKEKGAEKETLRSD